MNSSTVTILIDTYNYGEFVEEAVQSVLAQDFPAERMEVLIVDDGSTDDTPQRLAKFGDRIRYLHKPNGGQASAFNFGFNASRGEIVAFLDADDYWLPQKLKLIADQFERRPDVGMVYHDFRTMHPGGEYRDSGFTGQSGFLPKSRKELLGFDLHPTSALAFRRRVLEKILPVPEELVIQADAYLSACAIFTAPVMYIPETLAVYRIHGANLWNVQAGNGNTERLRRRMTTTRAVGGRVREWLRLNNVNSEAPNIRSFLMLWKLSSEGDEFQLAPPSRVRFLRHLLEYPRYYGVRMTWRHRVVSYANAFGALFTGYQHFHLLDEWRMRAKRALFGRSRVRDSVRTTRENVNGTVK